MSAKELWFWLHQVAKACPKWTLGVRKTIYWLNHHHELMTEQVYLSTTDGTHADCFHKFRAWLALDIPIECPGALPEITTFIQLQFQRAREQWNGT